MDLNEDQQRIVNMAVDWYNNSSEQVFQYSGAAGTGKSVTMNAIIQALGLTIDEVAPMSYIGAAAIIMRLKGLVNAKTIHSWLYGLEWIDTGEIDTYLNKPKKIKRFVPKPLPPNKKLICIDEAGCVPMYLKDEIESRGLKILCCGDLNQLPPVGDNPAYLYTGKVHYLTQIMRQNENSGIVHLAHEILAGKQVEHGTYGNVEVMYKDEITKDIIANAQVVICGKNDTREKFNRYIRKQILHNESTLPGYGEKVVCRQNNWAIDANGINLANGLIGDVVSAPDPSTFDGKVFYMDFKPSLSNIPFSGLMCSYAYFVANTNERKQIKQSPYYIGEKFEFAYGITTHISQGAQYNNGIYFQEYLNPLINKNLNYTGITRFSDHCIYFIDKRKFF